MTSFMCIDLFSFQTLLFKIFHSITELQGLEWASGDHLVQPGPGSDPWGTSLATGSGGRHPKSKAISLMDLQKVAP